jgi:multidrug efflux pump subunit AcrA (membrane-fusion protein)
MYLMVKFITDRVSPAVLIPSAALVTRSSGDMQVPVLDSDNTVHYRTVALGRDFGAEVEIVSGLQGNEMVAVHPGDMLPNGERIQPIEQKMAGK